MVFINKVREIIKLFEESSREEIGISLLAYEEYICKNNKVSDKELKDLTDIFNYYDQKYSDSYPSLINEKLQNSQDLICENNSNFEKDGYNFKITYDKRTSDGTMFDVSVRNKDSLLFLDEFNYTITDKHIKSNYYDDSFGTTLKACKEVQNQINKTNIEDILKSYKI